MLYAYLLRGFTRTFSDRLKSVIKVKSHSDHLDGLLGFKINFRLLDV